MKKTKQLVTVASAFACIAMASCGTTPTAEPETSEFYQATSNVSQDSSGTVVSEDTRDPKIVEVYNAYLANGGTLSYEEWYASIKGETGPKGEDGEDGRGVVSIEKTSTKDNVDTYTITYTDGTTGTFTVTNGKNGEQGIQGKAGEDGQTPTITIGSNGNWFVDGEDTGIKAQGPKGESGDTPYIGKNGNWWIGETDTGVVADYPNSDEREWTLDQIVMSSCLQYQAQTINGVSGFVVSGYDYSALSLDSDEYELFDYKDQYTYEEYIALGNAIKSGNVDIVVPNYIGTVPVIGVSNCFAGKSLNAISLSKNTVYLAKSAFKDCSSLAKVDFNGAKVSTIPEYCFYGTAIKDIKLSSTVTKLADYAFGTVYFDDFDYSHIKYFGKYSLQYLMAPCVYLTKDVEYVGSYAFSSTFVFIEHDSIPSNWGDNIAGTDEIGGAVTTKCINNGEYIYNLCDGGISLHAYLGEEKWLTIPSTIDGQNVAQIGYGFDAYTDDYINYWFSKLGHKDEDVYQINRLKGVIIPNTVTSIEFGAMLDYGTFIYIPESVIVMSQYVGTSCGDDDFFASSINFESTSLPVIKKGWIATSESVSGSDLSTLSSRYYQTGIDLSKVSYDEEKDMVFYKETVGYSLLASLDNESQNLSIPSVYNEQDVVMIRRAAVKGNAKAKSITLEPGIVKIQSYAFEVLEDLSYVYIPLSVSVINAYGFDGVCDNYYVVATAKPEEWDSYWAGSSTSSYEVNWGTTSKPKTNNDFVYVEKENVVALLNYVGSSRTIKIPRSIDGKTVTTIKTDFYYQDQAYSDVKIYIPSNVETIETKAFVFYYFSSSTAYYPYFYLEIASIPSGFANYWTYNSYQRSSSYAYCYKGQTLDY